MEHSLKKKIRYFLSSQYRGRSEIHGTLRELQSFGPIVIVGGILRDLILSNNLEFRSDLDLVIDPPDPDSFRDYVIWFGAKKNRFGGFSLPGRKWKIDIWLLKETWAHQAGFVDVMKFDDLLNTTFFNCDAIVYELTSGKVVTKNRYFRELSRRWLEINLRPNPNPIGNTVRAFRYAMMKNFSWGPKLSEHVDATLESTDWSTLVKYELHSHHSRTIEYFGKGKFRDNLRRHVAAGRDEEFFPFDSDKKEQLSLRL